MSRDPRRSPRLLARDLAGLAWWYPVAMVVAAAPRAALGPLAALGGDLRRLASRERELWRAELRALFGDRPLPASEDQILRDAFRGVALGDLEVLRYPALSPESIGTTAVIEGRQHLDAALARGRGAIVLIGHFGANQMIMPALGHQGYPMNQLSAPPTVWAELLRDTRTTPLWERTLARRWALEQRLPVRHINVFKFLRPAFECLARNEVLGLAFDGGGGERWVQARLMARTANLSAQPAQLWRKTGAALIPAVVLWDPAQRRHRVVLEAPLAWEAVGPRAEADRHNVQRYVDAFATWVARHPDHYLPFVMMRRRLRGQDLRPFFEGWPPAEGGLDPVEAARRLREAGART